MTGVLAGLRVVEAAAFVAAPLGGMTLAQMGADVIRIDSVGGGLDYRRWPVTPEGTSLFWTGLNKAKRSVVLDLATPEGRELAMALATAPGDDAGLFLTNFPPRGWLDHDKLRARRADLIQFTLMGDRLGGSAVDYTVNARVGLPFMTGPRDGTGAVNHVLPAWDLITGQMVAVGLLAAERHRRRSGQGQHVKLSLEDVALAVVAHLGLVTEAELGQPRERHGNDLFGAFGRDFTCADGRRVMLVGLTLKQWKAIVETCGIGDQVRQLEARLGVDLSQEGERFRHREALNALVGPWIAARPLAEVRAALDRTGACWGAYQDIATLAQDDPACSPANPMFARIEQPGVGRVLAAGIPLEFSGQQRTEPAPAPLLGQHTEQVLTELLGLPGAEFGRLHDRGIVRTAVPG
ncbi:MULTISPECIES: CoA transferase [Ramlibacter]|uniref:2-methylfumaryl-CoA isomerase n=1 Tax=Ramlibacter pinisoli TaxID=2682844 RepID=A0A6N8J0A1_9BURK|nr:MULTISPECIES: CoA transferase [Ramlibacter]MBA2962300.1 CoA transferase [Ramlibacter sp. CGMCC 1.13660]MVQ32242.1 2-methylfumaryl-CoA isomerase [Ramlibacter pinisoli]